MSRVFEQEIAYHNKVKYVSNHQGLKGRVLIGHFVRLADGTKWINVAWEPTAGGVKLIFENVDELEKVNGMYDFKKQAWNKGGRISIDRMRFYKKVENWELIHGIR